MAESRKAFNERYTEGDKIKPRIIKGLTIDQTLSLNAWQKYMFEHHWVTLAHCYRVEEDVAAFNKYANLGIEETVLRVNALGHDMGKGWIPATTLEKNDDLFEWETTAFRRHPDLAVQMLRVSGFDEGYDLDGMEQHHERWDGGGYPKGLKGEEISLMGRMLKLSDDWDALVNVREYKDEWSYLRTISYIVRNRGIIYDPEMSIKFLRFKLDQIKDTYGQVSWLKGVIRYLNKLEGRPERVALVGVSESPVNKINERTILPDTFVLASQSGRVVLL